MDEDDIRNTGLDGFVFTEDMDYVSELTLAMPSSSGTKQSSRRMVQLTSGIESRSGLRHWIQFEPVLEPLHMPGLGMGLFCPFLTTLPR